MIAKTASFVLFWIGDAISRAMHARGLGWLYYVYNWCMCKSYEIEERAGLSYMWRFPSDD